MAGDLSDIQFLLSGTDGKTGGAIGTNQAFSQTASPTEQITGVTIIEGVFNELGDGTLTYNEVAQTLAWQPRNGAVGPAVDVSNDGTYAIQSASNGGYLNVTVVASGLPDNGVSDVITITPWMDEVFNEVSKDQSYDSVTRYRCVYYKNNNSVDAKRDALLWIGKVTEGADKISIGLDQAAAGGIAVATADEFTAPANVTFTAPTTEALALVLGNLAADSWRAFWIRQIVPAKTIVPTKPNHFSLAHSVLV